MHFIYLYFLSNVQNVELCNVQPFTNDNCISTYWKWFGIEVYTKPAWFHFGLNLSYFSRFFWKKPCKKKKFHKNCFDKKEKSWTNFKMFQKTQKFQSRLSHYRPFKTKIFSVPTHFLELVPPLPATILAPPQPWRCIEDLKWDLIY